MKLAIRLQIVAFLAFGFSAALYGQSLDSLLMRVVANNPELKALNSEYEAELQRVDQVSVLSNPTLGVGVPILRPETRLGPQLLMVSASQMFPWFGTFKAKKDVVIAMSKARYEKISALRLELFYQLKSSYYNLSFLRLKKKLVGGNIRLYESLENVALSNVESGQSSTADVLRIQLRVNELNQLVKHLENEESAQILTINQLTNQDWKTGVVTSAELSENLLTNFDTAYYRAKITEHHPLVAKLDRQIEASENSQVVNKKANSPTIGVGLDYNWVGQRTDANPVSNGRDILVPKVMVSIPLYRKGYNAKDMEESYIQDALKYEKEALLDKIMKLLMQYKLDYENSILQINLHREQIKTTERTIDILLTNYSASGSGFDDLLQLENQLLQHETGLVKGLMDMNIAVAKIERLTDF